MIQEVITVAIVAYAGWVVARRYMSGLIPGLKKSRGIASSCGDGCSQCRACQPAASAATPTQQPQQPAQKPSTSMPIHFVRKINAAE